MSVPPPPGPTRMDDEDSRVDKPLGETAAAKRALGKTGAEISKVSATPVTRSDRQRRGQPSGGVGLRAAPHQKPGTPEKLEAAHSQVRDKVEATKEERRQRVWDKLDSAKKQGDEKLGRLRPFQPQRSGAGHVDVDVDGGDNNDSDDSTGNGGGDAGRDA